MEANDDRTVQRQPVPEASEKWKAGDRAAVQEVDGGWVCILAEDARKMGITEDTPGWQFVQVVDRG